MATIELTTLETVKSLLKIKSTETQRDTEISMLIKMVSQHVEDNILQRYAKIDNYEEIFDVEEGQGSVLLPAWPIVSVSAVYQDSDHDFPASSLIDPGDYHFGTTEKDRGEIVFDEPLDEGRRTLKVSWNGGMSDTPANLEGVYSSVSLATAYQTALIFRRVDKLQITREQIDGAQTNFEPSKIHSLVKTLLVPYCRDPLHIFGLFKEVE